MKRLTILLLILALSLPFIACGELAVLDEGKKYEIKSEIHSLNLKINAADFKINTGEEFIIESNLKYLSVNEKNGVLTVTDTAPSNSNYREPYLTLTLPLDISLDEATIATGAAKMTVESLSADRINLNLGAGDAHFDALYARRAANIVGGAGKFSVLSGELTALSLVMGVGELKLGSALRGECDLNLGVGKVDLTLFGDIDDYKLDIRKGVGKITVDGNAVTDFGTSGNGENTITVQGGVGDIIISFAK